MKKVLKYIKFGLAAVLILFLALTALYQTYQIKGETFRSGYTYEIHIGTNKTLFNPYFLFRNLYIFLSKITCRMDTDGIYWCKECGTPLITNTCDNCGSDGRYLAVDARPVFPEEKRMYESFFGLELPENILVSRNRIIFEGKTLLTFGFNFYDMQLILKTKKDKVIERLKKSSEISRYEFIKMIRYSNEDSLNNKIREATEFVKEVSEKYDDRFKVISFSGGKDSTVTADLVKNAIGITKLFFADTTLEYEETYSFIKDFTEKYGFELIKDANGSYYRNPNDFWEIVEELGPPSISYRWCCSVFKAYPVNKFHKETGLKTLAFDGIRKHESIRRVNYLEVTRIRKISNQIAAYPIFHWKEMDVWLYILFNNLIYNPLYDYGHRRIGCWVCPNASPFSCFIRKKTHLDKWSKFEKILLEYAKKHGRNEKWVIENYWRLRRPKKDKFPTVKKVIHKNTYTYQSKVLARNNLFEFFKPLGGYKIDLINGELTVKIGSNNPILIEYYPNRNLIEVTAIDNNELRKFERQLLKAINCIGCGGCVGYCPNNAITVKKRRLVIDESKCTRCGKCVSSDCVSLNYRIKRLTVFEVNGFEA